MADIDVEADDVLKDEWISALKTLAPIASGLATIGSNPEEWVRELIAEWAVGGILDAAQYAIGWIVYMFEVVRTAILDASGPFSAPLLLIESAIVGTIETIYGLALGVSNSAGLAGPPAVAVAVFLLSAVLALVTYALVYALLNAVPGGGIYEGAIENLEDLRE